MLPFGLYCILSGTNFVSRCKPVWGIFAINPLISLANCVTICFPCSLAFSCISIFEDDSSLKGLFSLLQCSAARAVGGRFPESGKAVFRVMCAERAHGRDLRLSRRGLGCFVLFLILLAISLFI